MRTCASRGSRTRWSKHRGPNRPRWFPTIAARKGDLSHQAIVQPHMAEARTRFAGGVLVVMALFKID